MKTIVASTICFILGLLVGWLCAPGTHPTSPQPDKTESPTTPVAPASKPVEPQREPPTLEQALGSIPVAIPQARGLISGRVKTREGKAIAGGTIAGHAVAADLPPAGKHPTLTEDVSNLVRRRMLAQKTQCSTKTDERGYYKLEVAVGLVYELSGEHPDYELYAARRKVARAGETFNFVAGPQVRIKIDVRNPDGTAPSRARIMVAWPGVESAPIQKDWSADSPVVGFYPERVTVFAQSWDEPEIRSEAIELVFEHGVEPPAIALVMRTIPGIKGRWIAPEFGNHSGITIACTLLGKGPAMELGQRFVKGEGFFAERTPQGEDAVFRFLNLEPGEYTVCALAYSRVVAFYSCAVDKSLVIKDLEFATPGLGQSVVARVFSPTAEPVEDARFRLFSKGPASSSGEPVVSLRQADGVYLICCYAMGESVSNEGRYALTVECSLGRQEVEVFAGVTTEVVFRFAEPAVVRVKLAESKRLDFSKLDVELVQKSIIDPNTRQTTSKRQVNGTWEFRPASPGSYEVILWLKHTQFDRRELSSQTIHVVTGTNEFSLGLPPVYTLKVKLPDATPGQTVFLRPRERNAQWNLHVESNEAGVAEFRMLPLGRFTISCNGKAMLVELTGDAEVEFKPAEFNAMLIEIYDPKGAFALAGLRTGDLIIGANGVDFETARQKVKTLQYLEDDKPVKLKILRDNTEFEVEIESGKVYRYSRGAHLEDVPR